MVKLKILFIIGDSNCYSFYNLSKICQTFNSNTFYQYVNLDVKLQNSLYYTEWILFIFQIFEKRQFVMIKISLFYSIFNANVY